MRGGCYLGVNKVKGRGTNTQVKFTERGDRDDTFRVRSFDQEICTVVWVALCTLEKDNFFPLPLPSFTTR